MNNYVLKHDFGYGTESEEINKLCLRNVKDLKAYINDLLKHQFLSWAILKSVIYIEIEKGE